MKREFGQPCDAVSDNIDTVLSIFDNQREKEDSYICLI